MYARITPNASAALPGELQDIVNTNIGNSTTRNTDFFNVTFTTEYREKFEVVATEEEFKDLVNALIRAYNARQPKGSPEVIQTRLF